ncbi:hypothetical protein WMF28_15730 [Sorangium sp. So ce590]|uniref:hypothetical protein n=1 Tax=Sorangium sp. So ce590 TaxID=3133317 RepID=UPI003F5E0B30
MPRLRAGCDPRIARALCRGLSRWIEAQGKRADAQALCIERYDERRQEVTPPCERFDYEVWKPYTSTP